MTSSSNPATRKQAPGGETSNARTRYAPTKSELPHPAGLGTAAAGVGAGHRKRDRPSARFPRRGLLRLPESYTCVPRVPVSFAT